MFFRRQIRDVGLIIVGMGMGLPVPFNDLILWALGGVAMIIGMIVVAIGTGINKEDS